MLLLLSLSRHKHNTDGVVVVTTGGEDNRAHRPTKEGMDGVVGLTSVLPELLPMVPPMEVEQITGI